MNTDKERGTEYENNWRKYERRAKGEKKEMEGYIEGWEMARIKTKGRQKIKNR